MFKQYPATPVTADWKSWNVDFAYLEDPGRDMNEDVGAEQ